MTAKMGGIGMKHEVEYQDRRYNGNICMKCAVMANECCWLRENKPVRGWTATPKVLRAKDRDVLSYQVTRCPYYREKPRLSIFKIKSSIDDWMLTEKEFEKWL